MPAQGVSSGIAYAPGGSGGGNTSIALAGVQTIPDGVPTTLVFDTVEASTNLVGGVPTVPANGDYWVNAQVALNGAGTAGGATFYVSGSIFGVIDQDVTPATGTGLATTLGVLRRVTLSMGETLSAVVLGATGAVLTAGGSVTGTYLQFWAV